MKTPHIILQVLVALLLLSNSACKKENSDRESLSFINDVPYYHFTDSDQPWLSARQGDEWKFESTKGYQRTYKVYYIFKELKAKHIEFTGPGLLSNSAVLVNYYDGMTVRISRTDSLAIGGGELRFYRDAALLSNLNSGGVDKNKSRFYAAGEWSEFIGNTDLISDYYSCRGLKFPNASALEGPFGQLLVAGRQCNEVVSFIGTQRGPNCTALPAHSIQELYYDRRAGIVRMISAAGEVWNRVP